MHSRLAPRTAAIAAALMVAGVALAGCTAAAPNAAKTHSAAATTVPGLPSGVTQATALPTDIPNDSKTRADVKLVACTSTGDGWKASGTVSNGGKSPATTVITVFFTTDKATVVGAAQTRVTVKAGDKRNWTAEKTFTAPSKTLCVLRGAGQAG
ncbi:hypothetical protein [Humibacter sp.]|jgi:hypothetical protein|uniref:hypothetical protein n=1 Tax=Humibacter sp. TaxID=1940291 RepID=UPI002BAC4DFE|nr:hypothetical protein [Humibacter sp.]HVX08983.1 hypothetical protein [Humibacter sp.]